MARTFTPRVNRHVTYVKSGGKLKPATITAVAGNVLSLRIGRGGETYTGVNKRTTDNQTGVWTNVFYEI